MAASYSGTTPPLKVSGLSFSYGAHEALSGDSFSLAPGSFTALLGINGAGKTTLFSLITRLFESQAGTINIMGRELRRHGSVALAPLGVVFQDQTLDLDLTVEQNLQYFGSLRGLSRREAAPRISKLLDEFGLTDRRSAKTRQLSGGMRRRLEVARALLHEPKLLVLDEPTVGLDIPSRKSLLEGVHRLAREKGVAVLWATHLSDEVLPGDRVILLHQGKVLFDGMLSDLLAATGEPNLEAAFEAMCGVAEAARS